MKSGFTYVLYGGKHWSNLPVFSPHREEFETTILKAVKLPNLNEGKGTLTSQQCTTWYQWAASSHSCVALTTDVDSLEQSLWLHPVSVLDVYWRPLCFISSEILTDLVCLVYLPRNVEPSTKHHRRISRGFLHNMKWIIYFFPLESRIHVTHSFM